MTLRSPQNSLTQQLLMRVSRANRLSAIRRPKLQLNHIKKKKGSIKLKRPHLANLEKLIDQIYPQL